MSYFTLPSGSSRPSFYAIATVADLRATQPVSLFAKGMLAQLASGTQYVYDPSSFAADNGTTVIKPDGLLPVYPGRWLQSTSGAVTGTGTNKTIPRWTAATTLGDSAVLQEEGAILTMFNLVNGAGVYGSNIQEVALNSITGTGSGATCALVVSGGVIRWLGIMKPGKGYVVGDTLQPNVAPFTATIQVQSIVSSQRGTTDYGTTGRIGAGTTEPTAGVDSRLGAQFEGWNRQAISLGPSPYEFSTPTTLRVGGLTSTNVDYSNASGYYAQLIVARLSSASVKTVIGVYGNTVYDTVTGATSANMQAGAFTASRLYPTDTATNVTMHGVTATAQTASTGGPYTIPAIYGVRSAVFLGATGTTTSVYDIYAGTYQGGFAQRVAAGNTITDWANLYLTQPYAAAGATITNFYGVRLVGASAAGATFGTTYALKLEAVQGTVTTRWGISQEDDAATNQILGNVGLGVNPGAGYPIDSIAITNVGVGYTLGIYPNVALTNVVGSGSGATADIFVGPGGNILLATLRAPGQGYKTTDVLSCASIGPGAGFQLSVTTVTKYARAIGVFAAARLGANTTNPMAPLTSSGLALVNAGGSYLSTNPSAQTLGVDGYYANVAVDSSAEVGGLSTPGLFAQATGIYANVRYDLTAITNALIYGGILQVSPALMGASSASVYGLLARPYVATAAITGKSINQFYAINAEARVAQPTGVNNTFSEIAAVSARVNFNPATVQNITYAYGVKIIGDIAGAAHAVNTAYSLYVGPFNTAGGVTITNYYGVYQFDTAAKNVLAGKTYVGGINDATAVLHLDGSTTARASLRITAGVAPTAPNGGDLWWDNSYIRFYTGATTKNVFIFTQIAASAGAGTFTINGPTNTIHADSTFAGTVGATQYTIGDIVTALKNAGVLAA